MSPLLLLLVCSLAAPMHAQTVDAMLRQLLTGMGNLNTAVSEVTQRVARAESRQLTSELMILDKLMKLEKGLANAQGINNKTQQDFQKTLKDLQAEIRKGKPDTKQIDASLKTLAAAALTTQQKVDAAQSCCQSSHASHAAQLKNIESKLNSSPVTAAPGQNCFPSNLPVDCGAVYASGKQSSGVYLIQAPGARPTRVYCDKGWTVIQQRVTNDQSFEQNHADYVRGFGNPLTDHWAGLSTIRGLTAAFNYTMRVTMRLDDRAIFNNKRYASYRRDGDGGQKWLDVADFGVGPGPDYRLRARGITTNLQFSSGARQFQLVHDGMCFSTVDRDRDGSSRNLAKEFAAGWWYGSSTYVDFNGKWNKHCGCSVQNNVCFWLQQYYGRSVRMVIKRRN